MHRVTLDNNGSSYQRGLKQQESRDDGDVYANRYQGQNSAIKQTPVPAYTWSAAGDAHPTAYVVDGT
jgi:hypothetical protein